MTTYQVDRTDSTPQRVPRGVGHMLVVVGVWMIFLAGCGGIQPPVLEQNLEVFRDEIEGFSFRPPEGWLQQSRANVPRREQRNQERMLVKYNRGSGKQPSVFQVSAVDLPTDTDFTAYLDKALGKTEKRTTSKPEDVQVGGLSGKRETYSTKWDREAVTKEIVSVRRGPRVYFFTGVYAPTDKQAKDTIRKILESVEWQHERKD